MSRLASDSFTVGRKSKNGPEFGSFHSATSGTRLEWQKTLGSRLATAVAQLVELSRTNPDVEGSLPVATGTK
jgi:hypothetical protein